MLIYRQITMEKDDKNTGGLNEEKENFISSRSHAVVASLPIWSI